MKRYLPYLFLCSSRNLNLKYISMATSMATSEGGTIVTSGATSFVHQFTNVVVKLNSNSFINA